MASPTYLVTGANGHVGNTVVRALVRRGYSVRCLVLPGSRNGALAGLPVEITEGDLLRPDSLAPWLGPFSGEDAFVIHTAGIVSISSRRRQEVEAVNVEGTRNLLAACRRRGIRRFLYTSSVHAIPEAPGRQVIGEPDVLSPDRVVGLYARTKALATQLVLDSAADGMEPVVVYPSGILGPGDYGRGHLTQLVRDYLSGRLVACVRGGYNFVDVRDVAEGILLAAEKGRGGDSFLLCGHYASIPQLLQLLHEVSGRPPVRWVLPYPLAMATAPLSELYYALRRQPPLYTAYSLYTLQSNSNFSIARAKERLGYQPRPLRETVQDTVEWLRRRDSLA